MDNAPRRLRDVFAEAYADGITEIPADARFYANEDCKRLGLTNAAMVPDLAAHDAAVREALRFALWEDVRDAIIDGYSDARDYEDRVRDARKLADNATRDILGPAPHTAPQAHEGDFDS